MTNRTLPHDPYITAVLDTLTAAGLEPTTYWSSDAETNPYGDGSDTMLNTVIAFDGDHPAISDAVAPEGVLLLWEHPAEEWQYAERLSGGRNAEPDFFGLGLYVDPAHLAAAVWALFAGGKRPFAPGEEWVQAGPVREAVAAWDASE